MTGYGRFGGAPEPESSIPAASGSCFPSSSLAMRARLRTSVRCARCASEGDWGSFMRCSRCKVSIYCVSPGPCSSAPADSLPYSPTSAKPPIGHTTSPSARPHHPKHHPVRRPTKYGESPFPAMPTERAAPAHSRPNSSTHHMRYIPRAFLVRCSDKSAFLSSSFDTSPTIPFPSQRHVTPGWTTKPQHT